MIDILACTALGAGLYRWRGHGKVSGPRWLKLVLTAFFLCLPLAEAGEWVRLTGAMPVTMWLLSLGMGAYFDLAHTRPEKPHDRIGAFQEEPDFAWLRLLIPSGTIAGDRYWYEFAALAVTGLAATLGPGLALVLLGHWSGLLLALSGALKAPAYAIGWRVASGARATVIGEWLTGAGMGLGVGIALG